MPTIQVEPNQLRTMSTAMEQASESIDAALRALQAKVTVMVADWSGDAQLEFKAKFNREYVQASVKATELAEIAKLVNLLAEEYGTIDRAASEALGGQ